MAVGQPQGQPPDGRAEFLLWRVALIVVTAIALLRLRFVALNEDVAFLLVAADRLAGGGKFGADLLEMNTPPAVMLYWPAAALHSLTGIRADIATQGLVMLVVLALALFTERITRQALADDEGRARATAAFLTVATVFALALPAYQFGQRDHLVVAFLLPTLALTTAQRLGRAIGQRDSIAVGALAALAVAVKPHYLLLLLVLWAWRMRREGLARLIKAPDVLAVVAAGLLLAGLSLALYPEWLDVARLATRYYDGLSRPLGTLVAAFLRYDIGGISGGLLALAAWRFGAIARPLRDHMATLLVAAPVFLLIFLIQKKGFAYHLVPFDTVTLIAALATGYGVLTPRRPLAPALIAASVAVLMVLATWNAADRHVATEDIAGDPVIQAVATHDRGGGLAFLSVHPMPGIQATVLLGTRWDLRGSILWLLPGLETRLAGAGIGLGELDSAKDKPQLVTDALWYRGSIVADLARDRPDVVLVLRADAPDEPPVPPILEFLSGDPEFATVWRDFAPTGSIESDGKRYDLYVRRAD